MKPCPYPIVDLLPHAPPMILLDQVDAYDANNVEASLTIRDDSPFVKDRRVPSYVALEYMAQGIAAYSGLQALEKNEAVKIGFLLGTRKLRLWTHELFVGDNLVVNVHVLYNDGEMAAFECRTMREGQIVAEASINVYQPNNLDQIAGQRLGQKR